MTALLFCQGFPESWSRAGSRHRNHLRPCHRRDRTPLPSEASLRNGSRCSRNLTRCTSPPYHAEQFDPRNTRICEWGESECGAGRWCVVAGGIADEDKGAAEEGRGTCGAVDGGEEVFEGSGLCVCCYRVNSAFCFLKMLGWILIGDVCSGRFLSFRVSSSPFSICSYIQTKRA